MAKVKNYLITKNYKITESFYLLHTLDNASREDDLNRLRYKYTQMQHLLHESALTYLKNLDGVIVDVGIVKNDQKMFADHMIRLYEKYNSEPCNILYCDLDVVFFNECDVFGKYDHFTMANNCGVRYYPYGGVDDNVWDIMFAELEKWNTDYCYGEKEYNWSREQDIYNLMKNYYGFNHPFEDEMLQNVYNEYCKTKSILHYNGCKSDLQDIKIFGHCPNTFRAKRIYELSLNNDYHLIQNILHAPPWDRQHPNETPPEWSRLYPY